MVQVDSLATVRSEVMKSEIPECETLILKENGGELVTKVPVTSVIAVSEDT